jgi:hypothetical protein
VLPKFLKPVSPAPRAKTGRGVGAGSSKLSGITAGNPGFGCVGRAVDDDAMNEPTAFASKGRHVLPQAPGVNALLYCIPGGPGGGKPSPCGFGATGRSGGPRPGLAVTGRSGTTWSNIGLARLSTSGGIGIGSCEKREKGGGSAMSMPFHIRPHCSETACRCATPPHQQVGARVSLVVVRVLNALANVGHGRGLQRIQVARERRVDAGEGRDCRRRRRPGERRLLQCLTEVCAWSQQTRT